MLDGKLRETFPDTSLNEHERYSELFSYLVAGCLFYRAPDGAHVYYPGASSTHGAGIDAMEGFCRILPMISAWICSGRSSVIQDFDGREVDLVAMAKEGLLAGTDPQSKGFWGYIRDRDQRIVEAADVALSVWLLREHLWPQLSGAEKDMLAKWLLSINGKAIPDCNWHLFPVMVNEVLSSLDYPGDSVLSLEHYSRLKSFYQGNGWFSDGPDGPYDYYNAWGIHYSLFWINLISPELDPGFIDSSLNDFVCSYKYFFSTAGIPMTGRSICYRMAAPAPLIAAATKGMDSIRSGMARRALDCVWRYFVKNGAVQRGMITQGYWHEDVSLLDSYSGPGSSLWSTRSLTLAFYNPPHSDFWTAPPETLPVEQSDYSVTIPEIQWEIKGTTLTREVQIVKTNKTGVLRKKTNRSSLLPRLSTSILRLFNRTPDEYACYELRIYSSLHPFWLDEQRATSNELKAPPKVGLSNEG
ncbi:MAG: DUF2264 domain-containing protein [Anaerolineae bacterium]|nr:DUF2264 domain-containing protein [Anaerolineae bacterium]